MKGGTARLDWRPTPSHLRAVAVGFGGTVAALIFGRPGLLVLVTPLVVVAVWSIVSRPAGRPGVAIVARPGTLREGESTRWTATVTEADGVERVAVRFAAAPWWQFDSPNGALVVDATDRNESEPLTVTMIARSTWWGRREFGGGLIAVESAWGAFRAGPAPLPRRPLTTLPLPAVFDRAAPVPNPNGLVGANQSRRPGDGAEFASIRPFTAGDRLRRVHWPVSLRTGTLHATVSAVDLDTHVTLVLDATTDVGASEGIDGKASSLDRGVRAAAAVAEHFVRRGDRVGLLGAGSKTRLAIRTGSGQRHLRRILGALAHVESGYLAGHRWSAQRQRIEPGGLVIAFSPLLDAGSISYLHALAGRRLTVVVVDTLPDNLLGHFAGSPREVELGWRLRLLERRAVLEQLRSDGIPVAPWAGPGSLDVVLRQLSRQASAPRVGR